MTVQRTFGELRALHGDEIAMLIAECGEGLVGEALFAARIRHRNERIARDPRLPRPELYRHQDRSRSGSGRTPRGHLQMHRSCMPVRPGEQVEVWLGCKDRPLSAARAWTLACSSGHNWRQEVYPGGNKDDCGHWRRR